MKRLLKRKEIRFLIGGGWNTVFGYGCFVFLYYLLRRFTAGHELVFYDVILVLSQVVAVIQAYFCYKYFVFKIHGLSIAEFFRFSTVYIYLLPLNLVALPLLVGKAGWSPPMAQAATVFVTAILSYFSHNHFTFRAPKAPKAAQLSLSGPR